ncbi:MAG: beta-ketoacyl synthase chain length factor [Crocinitomicaceae bacterium]|nr:beta-ketoacyl synthase chain length factor [Crocinitomicaceae bacterium]
MFVKDLQAISAQKTHDLTFEKGDYAIYSAATLPIVEPAYAEFIPLNLLRRMGKAVKMGIAAALPIINRSKPVDGIIVGTANGGLENCIDFLNQIVAYDEGILTPTNFVQSTPNALAGQLALMTKNTGYNSTHVNGSLSFENALLDAKLFFEATANEANLLVGSVEEISTYNYNIDLLAGRYKKEMIANNLLLQSNTEGSVCGEGASFFLLSNNPENALAEIVDTTQIIEPNEAELKELIHLFLKKNQLQIDAIDLLILGKNGDNRLDGWYDVFKQFFPASPAINYKHLTGDYRTISGFATYLAVQILSEKVNGTHPAFKNEIPTDCKNILIYNHFDGIRHGFILIKKGTTNVPL